jgi:hypothetical protein
MPARPLQAQHWLFALSSRFFLNTIALPARRRADFSMTAPKEEIALNP